ncbi:MAG TPA: LacI family transcriptional regulator [Anaerolineae bacterium]|nr:LacI family transcriptional regulator [Anaerolineae bacterium]
MMQKRRATITDVARLAGVSIATVSRVVNGTAPVAPDTVRRVEEAIAQLGYKPHSAARKLAGRRSGAIGLLLPEVAGDFFFPLVRSIAEAARANEYDLLIHVASDPQEESLSAPLGDHNVDGLLVFTGRLHDDEIARLHRLGFPLVLLFRTPPDALPIPYVMFENQEGARRLVEHLILVHGRRRIAFLRGPEGNEESAWREQGYRAALQAHAIPFDPNLVGMGGFHQQMARDVIHSWLLEGLHFDAVFAGDDEAAMGAMEALRRAGKRVPEDVAVVGFDDVSFSRLLNPPLTTVRAPIEAAATEAAQMLFAQIAGVHHPTAVTFPTELVIRQSCGCPAHSDQGSEQSP